MTQPTPDVIAAARAAQSKWKVPASVSLAQWALESGWGRALSGRNNPFGMKCPCGPDGVFHLPHTIVRTREEDRYGHSYYINAAFRDFDSIAEAFDLHAQLLATAPVYASAMAALPSLTGFIAKMAPRYATAHDYADMLWRIINGSDLTRYDG